MGRPPTIHREQILETARAVFAARGFEATTLGDIARELHVTAAALLRHFKSKQELFREALTGHIELPPFVEAISRIDATTDPRAVLRALAENFVPFAERAVTENIVVFLHANARPELVLPFDRDSDDSPPRRGIRIVEDYFRRAAEAGVIRIADPRAAARLFMGSLQAYVLLHRVVKVPPYPLDRYIDALIDLWTHGGIVTAAVGGTRVRKQKSPSPAPRSSGHRRGRDDGHDLLAKDARAARTRPRRDTGGKDGSSGVPRRRPRRSGPDR